MFSYRTVATNIEKDIIAAKKIDALFNRMFVEPLLGLGYPVKDLKLLQRIEKFIKPNDEKDLLSIWILLDFKIIREKLLAHASFMPYMNAKIIKANKRNVEPTLNELGSISSITLLCIKKVLLL